jgi:hypothetical protein
MKRITILLTACLLTSFMASAMCSSSGVSVVGDRKTLHKNSILILEFYGMSQDYVTGLGKKNLVWLRSKNAKVALQVIEVLKGEMNVTQVVFRPTCDLAEGDLYELLLDNLEDTRGLQRYNSETQKNEPYTFRIEKNTAINTPLSFTTTPVETKKEMTEYGCGPARFVHFSIAADRSLKYVRATVKNNKTGKTTTYILTIQDGKVVVGHGMCSGAFHFDDGDNFTVSFALMDNSGNTGRSSAPVNFTSPTVATQ